METLTLLLLGDWFWQPALPPFWLVSGAVLLAVLTVYSAIRQRETRWVAAATALMRLAAIAALLALLMGPSRMPAVSTQLTRPTLLVMLDQSASMQRDDMSGRTRYAVATEDWLAPGMLGRLQADWDLRFFGFDGSARATPPAAFAGPAQDLAGGSETLITHSFEQALNASRLPEGSSVVLLSDGRDTDGSSARLPAMLASSQRLPVFTVPLGGPRLARDLALIARPQQEYLLAGEQGMLQLRIMQSNAGESSTTVTVRGPGIDRSIPIHFRGLPSHTLNVPVAAEAPGMLEFDVAVAPLPGEEETTNNRRRVYLDVLARRMEVLILEGEPFWDTKFISQSLRKDDRIALTHITQVNSQRKACVTSRVEEPRSSIPSTLEDWAHYDLVILGRAVDRFLDPDPGKALTQYVAERGGRVLFARGKPYDDTKVPGIMLHQALRRVEPVVWGTPQEASEGAELLPQRGHPIFTVAGGSIVRRDAWAKIPAVERMSANVSLSPASRVLLWAQDGQSSPRTPVLTVMPYQRGMTAAITADGLWRWSLKGRREADLAGSYDRFWSNLVRWMVLGSDFRPGEEFTLRVSSRSVKVGEQVQVSLLSRGDLPQDADVTATITDPHGEARKLKLRPEAASLARWQVSLEPEIEGDYLVQITPPAIDGTQGDEAAPLQARFSTFLIDQERLHSSADIGYMHALAQLTGGEMLDPAQPDDLLDALNRRQAARLSPPVPEFIWDRGWVLLLLLGWLGVEWIVRRKGGLL